MTESNDESGSGYNDWTVSELDEEITERNKEYGPAGGTTLPLSGLKADKVAALEADDDRLERLQSGEDSDVTANAVTELAEEAKTGPVRRREANDERKAGEAELYERQQGEKTEPSTPQQHGVAADIAEQQAEERDRFFGYNATESTTESTAEESE